MCSAKIIKLDTLGSYVMGFRDQLTDNGRHRGQHEQLHKKLITLLEAQWCESEQKSCCAGNGNRAR